MTAPTASGSPLDPGEALPTAVAGSVTVVFGREPRDLVLPLLVGMFVLAWVPATMFPSWTPRMAVLLCAALPGIVYLVRQAASRDRTAGVAVGFIAFAIISAGLSDSVRSSLIGFVGRDLSVLTVAACFGLWALARTVSAGGQRMTSAVFIGSTVFVAIIGIVQVVADIQTGSLALQEGRPMSLLVNPVYFGAVCAGAGVASCRAAGRNVGWYHVAAVVTTAGCVLSGSRIAWLALVVLVLVQVAWERAPERLLGAGSVGVGFIVGLVADRAFSDWTNTIDRLSGDGAGRSTVWGYGLEAFVDRPLFGYGIGLFRPAVQGRFSTEFVRVAALDDSRQPWFDAHNIVVGTLVATGLVGLLLLIAWASLAARIARGPTAWAAAAIASTWLVQPVSLATLPLVMILLGVAMPVVVSTADESVAPSRAVLVPAVAISVLLGVGLLAADLRLRSAVDAPSIDSATSAARWFPGDPVVANVVAQVAKLDGGDLRANATSVEWREKSVAREPDRPYWWNLLAEEQLQLGDLDRASRSVDESLRRQPTNYATNRLALDIAVAGGDVSEIEERLKVLCELDEIACSLSIDDIDG